jgi:hypothetical protein
MPSQSGSMSDRRAIDLFTPGVLAAAFECGNSTAPLVIGPWTFIAAAVECPTLTGAARLEALSVAFAILGGTYEVMPKATKEYPEQGGKNTVITISDRNHLRSAMNLCVGLFYAIKVFASALALGRLGTHSIECLFGIVGSALRGQGQWRLWCGAEAFTALLSGMKELLGLATRSRAGRVAMAGTTLVRTDDGVEAGHPAYSEPGFEERAFLLHSAKAAVKGDQAAKEMMWDYTCGLAEHLRSNPIRLGSSPSPRAGAGAKGALLPPARRFRPVRAGDRLSSPGAPCARRGSAPAFF